MDRQDYLFEFLGAPYNSGTVVALNYSSVISKFVAHAVEFVAHGIEVVAHGFHIP
jgi:hypothetical protein